MYSKSEKKNCHVEFIHPKNTTKISAFYSWIMVGIIVCVICVVWFSSVLDVLVIIFSVVSIEVVSFLKREVVTAIVVLWISLEIVVEIIADITSDKVWFLVREVVSIALGIVVTISDKVWVNFTIVVGTLFCIGSSLHAVFPSEFSTHSYVSESVTG